MTNKGCLFISLAGIVVIAGIVIAVIKSDYKPPVLSETPPKPGYYDGGAHFTLTADGRITDFFLQAADSTLTYCSVYWDDNGTLLKDNRFTYNENSNSIKGMYTTDGSFYIEYSYYVCGEWRVTKVKEGHEETKWVSEKPTN